MITVSFDKVKAANTSGESFSKPPAGAYVMRITEVDHKKANMGVVIKFDIAEGEYKGYYTDLHNARGFWALSEYKSYRTEKAQKYFKAFYLMLEANNAGYKFDGDEQGFKDKLIGVVMGYEEYIGNDGTTKEHPYVDKLVDIATAKSGTIEPPKTKTITKPGAVAIDTTWAAVDDDHPF